jgi:hypothetical protein
MEKHALLTEYVEMLCASEATSLVVKGEGGLGKSYTTLKTLDNLGLKENINYLYVAGYMTPLQLFNTIAKSCTLEAPRLLVFDDIDALITNKISVALLKSALGEVRGKRVVSYHSSSSKVEGTPSFEFDGKIIIILNDTKQESAFGKPLLDRTIVFDMTLTHKELISYVEEILPNIHTKLSIEDKKLVWGKIKQFSDNQRFSVRSLIRAFDFYQYDKDNFMHMFVSSLKLTEEQKIYYQLANDKSKTAKEKATEFATKTGKSSRSYYRVEK